MPGLSTFTNYWLGTNPAILTGPDKIHNEVLAQNYSQAWFTRGRPIAEFIRGGKRLDDYVLLENAGTAVEYSPNDTMTWSNPQTMQMYSAEWRFTMAHSVVTEQETALQSDGDSTASQKIALKRIKKVKEQECFTSLLEKREAQFWAAPMSIQSEFEGNTAKRPYSIPCFINEESTYLPYGWTSTLMGLNPTTYSKWRNVLNRYDFNDYNDLNQQSKGLFDALGKTVNQIRFEAPPVSDLEASKTGPASNCVIFSSLVGVNLVEKLNRENNSQFIGDGRDAYRGNAKFGGWDVVYVPTLDTAALYSDGSTSYYTEQHASVQYSGPRFYLVNTNYLVPFFRQGYYFDRMTPFMNPNQPETMIMPVRLWGNLFCRSRSRQAIVSPGA